MSGTVTGSLVRLVLSGVKRQGADPRVLAREAGLPGWAFEDEEVRFPVARLARLWQVSAARLEDPRFGLHVAASWRLGACDLSDYLFDTAATLGEAFVAAFDYTRLLNSAGVNDIALTGSGSRGLVRYQIRTPDPAVNVIRTEFALGTLLQRERHATGRPVTPLQVAFSGRAPRSQRRPGPGVRHWADRLRRRDLHHDVQPGGSRPALVAFRSRIGEDPARRCRPRPALLQIVGLALPVTIQSHGHYRVSTNSAPRPETTGTNRK
jgi:hypothetical protein